MTVRTENEFLNLEEIARLTGSKRSVAQAAWLLDHGMPHLLDGKRVIVSRVHVRERLEGRVVVRSAGLNMSAIK
jgi:hypothetical protein